MYPITPLLASYVPFAHPPGPPFLPIRISSINSQSVLRNRLMLPISQHSPSLGVRYHYFSWPAPPVLLHRRRRRRHLAPFYLCVHCFSFILEQYYVFPKWRFPSSFLPDACIPAPPCASSVFISLSQRCFLPVVFLLVNVCQRKRLMGGNIKCPLPPIPRSIHSIYDPAPIVEPGSHQVDT